jgi:hypothetical protein
VHILPDNDPLLLRQSAGTRFVGKALTIGNINAIADSIADTRADLATLETKIAAELAKLAKLETKIDADLADLGKRIDAVVASTWATIAEADRRDSLRRGGPRREV